MASTTFAGTVTARVGAALLAAWTITACTPEFQNPTAIVDLRLLAVRADPPEVLIDLEAAMATGALTEPLPEITLMPLIVDPRGAGRAVAYRVQVCAIASNDEARGGTQRPGRVGDLVGQSPCANDDGTIAAGSALPTDGGVVPLAVTFTPTLAQLMEAARVDPLGIELGLPLTVTFTISAGDETVIAFKRIVFSRRLAADHVPNQNPVPNGYLVRNTRRDTATRFDLTTPPVSLAGRHLLLSLVPAVAEAYPARNYSLSERRFYTDRVPEETLRYSFYATRGTFSPGAVSNEPSPIRTNQVIDYEVVYQPPPDAPLAPGPVDVFVVARDERGGSSFARLRLDLQ